MANQGQPYRAPLAPRRLIGQPRKKRRWDVGPSQNALEIFLFRPRVGRDRAEHQNLRLVAKHLDDAPASTPGQGHLFSKCEFWKARLEQFLALAPKHRRNPLVDREFREVAPAEMGKELSCEHLRRPGARDERDLHLARSHPRAIPSDAGDGRRGGLSVAKKDHERVRLKVGTVG